MIKQDQMFPCLHIYRSKMVYKQYVRLTKPYRTNMLLLNNFFFLSDISCSDTVAQPGYCQLNLADGWQTSQDTEDYLLLLD